MENAESPQTYHRCGDRFCDSTAPKDTFDIGCIEDRKTLWAQLPEVLKDMLQGLHARPMTVATREWVLLRVAYLDLVARTRA